MTRTKYQHKYQKCSTCSRNIVAYNFEKHLQKQKECLNCGNLFCPSTRFDKFCSRSCSAIFNNQRRIHSEETKTKISESLKGVNVGKKYPNRKPKYERKSVKCSYCDDSFIIRVGAATNPKTCKKKECQKKLLSERARNSDYRRFWKQHINYNGVLLDSSWELLLAKQLDSLKINWIRPDKPLIWFDKDNVRRRYFPDFFLPDFGLYLEPKNPHGMRIQKEKFEILSKDHKIILLDSEEKCKNWRPMEESNPVPSILR